MMFCWQQESFMRSEKAFNDFAERSTTPTLQLRISKCSAYRPGPEPISTTVEPFEYIHPVIQRLTDIQLHAKAFPQACCILHQLLRRVLLLWFGDMAFIYV